MEEHLGRYIKWRSGLERTTRAFCYSQLRQAPSSVLWNDGSFLKVAYPVSDSAVVIFGGKARWVQHFNPTQKIPFFESFFPFTLPPCSSNGHRGVSIYDVPSDRWEDLAETVGSAECSYFNGTHLLAVDGTTKVGFHFFRPLGVGGDPKSQPEGRMAMFLLASSAVFPKKQVFCCCFAPFCEFFYNFLTKTQIYAEFGGKIFLGGK